MFDRPIDRDRLALEIHRVEPLIRAHKKLIATTPAPWPRPFAAELRTLKAEATLLYAIASHARGRLHLRKVTKSHAHLGLPPLAEFTLADQARFIGERWLLWARQEEARRVGIA